VPDMEGISENFLRQRIELIQQYFPEAVEEGHLDFDTLRQLLGGAIDDEQERYAFRWNGKGRALAISQAPSRGTLRPCKTESKDWETTQNVYIEGDNLEVLKLLQKSYHGQIKMIYIDPPYNTGHDFVYKDDFRDNIQNYKVVTGQVDSEGRKIQENTESNGRFHTDWLNMMYPRLRLARNLLAEDGVIFISIDDSEQATLKQICDEIFIPTNFIATLIWQNKKGGGNDSKYFAIEHEYIHVYAKNIDSLKAFYEAYEPEYLKRYKEEDKKGKFYWDTFRRKSGKQYYPIECPDGTILQYDDDGNPLSWLRSEKRFFKDKDAGEIKFDRLESGKWSVKFKQRLPKGKKPRSLFETIEVISDKGETSTGSSDVYELFKKDVFFNPKPVELLKFLLGFASNRDCTVLDFFSGSATMAQAVMQANADDGGNRKYILVQIPVNIDSVANGTGNDQKRIVANEKDVLNEIHAPHLLTEIAKERIRRAGESIKKTCEDKKRAKALDLGFRVFRLDTSNVRKWQGNPENVMQELQESVRTFIDGRKEQDVIYEILLKLGKPLTVPVRCRMAGDKNIYFIGNGSLVICLTEGFTSEDAEALVKMHEESEADEWQVVFSDACFASDVDKTNIRETLSSAGLADEGFLCI